jgi:hypothetical protein
MIVGQLAADDLTVSIGYRQRTAAIAQMHELFAADPSHDATSKDNFDGGLLLSASAFHNNAEPADLYFQPKQQNASRRVEIAD